MQHKKKKKKMYISVENRRISINIGRSGRYFVSERPYRQYYFFFDATIYIRIYVCMPVRVGVCSFSGQDLSSKLRNW